MEPTTGLEPVNLFLTKEVLYLLSYVGFRECSQQEDWRRSIRVKGMRDHLEIRRRPGRNFPGIPNSTYVVPTTMTCFMAATISYMPYVVERGGFEPPKATPADLQSAPFGRSGTSTLEKPALRAINSK